MIVTCQRDVYPVKYTTDYGFLGNKMMLHVLANKRLNEQEQNGEIETISSTIPRYHVAVIASFILQSLDLEVWRLAWLL